MNMREKLDISAYFVVGPENTLGRPVKDIIRAAVANGFTCLQIRSKVASARELIALCRDAAEVLKDLGRENDVALLVDDRLDVVLAAREEGIKVDGIHVGQSDIPASVCRKLLGPDAIVGLSARTHELLDYVSHADTSDIDYFGAGPLHETPTKKDCGATSMAISSRGALRSSRNCMKSALCRSWSAAASRPKTCQSSRPPVSKAFLSSVLSRGPRTPLRLRRK